MQTLKSNFGDIELNKQNPPDGEGQGYWRIMGRNIEKSNNHYIFSNTHT